MDSVQAAVDFDPDPLLDLLAPAPDPPLLVPAVLVVLGVELPLETLLDPGSPLRYSRLLVVLKPPDLLG